MTKQNDTVGAFLARRLPLLVMVVIPSIIAAVYLHSVGSMLDSMEQSSQQNSLITPPAQEVALPAVKTWTTDNSLRTAIAPSFTDSGSQESLLAALDRGIEAIAKLPETYSLACGGKVCTKALLATSALQFRSLLQKHGLTDVFYAAVAAEFDILESQAPSVLFTGYFQSSLKGSRTKSDIYKYPLYRKPDDLIAIDTTAYNSLKDKGLPSLLMGRVKDKKVVPYFSRDEIDHGSALSDKQLEILWVDDPVELFFMHIQGSAVVELDDGGRVQIGYADKNGHPYRPIGKWLIEKQLMKKEDVSMQSIERFLKEHPETQREIFAYNPSYVFFQEYQEGPIGAANVPLVAERAIATDVSLFPKGGLAYIETETPKSKANQNEPVEWQAFRRFMINLDTGGAIRGADRVDIFTGHGEEAEAMAGPLNRRGRLYFLVVRDGEARIAE
jgi:membrane-bound lytic murein transglycosylase A